MDEKTPQAIAINGATSRKAGDRRCNLVPLRIDVVLDCPVDETHPAHRPNRFGVDAIRIESGHEFRRAECLTDQAGSRKGSAVGAEKGARSGETQREGSRHEEGRALHSQLGYMINARLGSLVDYRRRSRIDQYVTNGRRPNSAVAADFVPPSARLGFTVCARGVEHSRTLNRGLARRCTGLGPATCSLPSAIL